MSINTIFSSLQMLYLYPNIRKEVAFNKYLSQPHDTNPAQPRNPRNGYVHHHLVNVIQGYVSHSVDGVRCEVSALHRLRDVECHRVALQAAAVASAAASSVVAHDLPPMLLQAAVAVVAVTRQGSSRQ
jgi:hypothetical protein